MFKTILAIHKLYVTYYTKFRQLQLLITIKLKQL